MSIYPSLEDMKASELIKAQVEAFRPSQQPPQYPGGGGGAGGAYPTLGMTGSNNGGGGALVATHYPRLHEFMGLELTEEMIRANMPEYLEQAVQQAVALPHAAGLAQIKAPISGTALIRSTITHGVREVVLTKVNSKLGLRVRAMNTGVFVCLVIDGSPASVSGVRFGDQILQIDGVDVVGLSVDKVHGIFKKAATTVRLVVRDRPFERTITLVRDSMGHIGFQFKNGKIINIVKDSSAARNGLLTEHTMLEINGKNVIGLKDKEITGIIGALPGNGLNLTIMPSFLYSHMVKEMDSSLFGKMDHSQDY